MHNDPAEGINSEIDEVAAYEANHASNQRGAVIGVVVVLAVPLLCMAYGLFSPSEQAYRDGHKATARVVSIEDTGNRSNDNPQVRLLLEVKPDDSKPYRVPVRKVVSVVDLPHYQPGALLSVKIHPTDRQTVVVIGPQQRPPSAP
ncbi:MAG: hypothetical protein AAFX99_20745 [Myxococcota bacterium]